MYSKKIRSKELKEKLPKKIVRNYSNKKICRSIFLSKKCRNISAKSIYLNNIRKKSIEKKLPIKIMSKDFLPKINSVEKISTCSLEIFLHSIPHNGRK